VTVKLQAPSSNNFIHKKKEKKEEKNMFSIKNTRWMRKNRYLVGIHGGKRKTATLLVVEGRE
jgi:hypothetical protein